MIVQVAVSVEDRILDTGEVYLVEHAALHSEVECAGVKTGGDVV